MAKLFNPEPHADALLQENMDEYFENENGCANRFVAEWWQVARFCPDLGKEGQWVIWGEKPGIWTIDNSRGNVESLCKATLGRMDTMHQRVGVQSFIKNAMVQNVLKLSKSDLMVRLEEFDQSPFLLNTPNGVIDLRTGRMREWQAGDKFFMQTSIAPDWAVEIPLWESHIEKMCRNTGEPEAVRSYVKRLVGMTLVGDQDEKPHIAPVLCGEGRNGKGSFVDTVRLALGSYAGQSSAKLLTAGEGDHTAEQAGLEGLRMVTVEEVLHINPSLFKMLTGGGRIRARKMRENDREFDKTWTIWVSNNKPIKWRDGDRTSAGLWSRVPTILLGEEMDENDRDERWSRRLEGELAGILAWAIDGCVEWRKNGAGLAGLQMPDCVRETTTERRESNDPLTIFLDENYERVEACNVTASSFMKKYTQWCKDTGEPNSGGRNTVYSELRERMKFKVDVGHGKQMRIYGLRERPLSFGSLIENSAPLMADMDYN